MNELPPDSAIIEYAKSDLPSVVPVRPTVLLIPNLAAIAIIFIPLEDQHSLPAELLFYAFSNFQRNMGDVFFAASLLFPFVFSIPLALWTIRLLTGASIKPAERAAAWSLAGLSTAMTLSVGCALLVARRDLGLLVKTFPGAIIVLLGLGFAVYKFRGLATISVTALAAMTCAFIAHGFFIVEICFLNGITPYAFWPRCIGPAADGLIVLSQLVALVILFRRCVRAQCPGEISFAGVVTPSEM